MYAGNTETDNKEDISFRDHQRPLRYEPCTVSVAGWLSTVPHLGYQYCLLVALDGTGTAPGRGTRDISAFPRVPITRTQQCSYIRQEPLHAPHIHGSPWKGGPRSVRPCHRSTLRGAAEIPLGLCARTLRLRISAPHENSFIPPCKQRNIVQLLFESYRYTIQVFPAVPHTAYYIRVHYIRRTRIIFEYTI